MKMDMFPEDIRPYLIPEPDGRMVYRCLGCAGEFGIGELLYTCPDCGKVLLLHIEHPERIERLSGETWRRLFDYRRMIKIPALQGIYRYHEFLGPVIPADSVVYLGEGHTPMIEANPLFQEEIGLKFYFKNDGQNPSASFKDRGMASALSYINFLIQSGRFSEILAVCASTGDTSASAALYASYLKPRVKSAVLLPHGKVTPQQLNQPLGSGAAVFEIPGVFDDCMKVVESLADHYNVALLNSKNAWRILGQESYSYEIAQDFDYDLSNKAVIAPIGNAGNITAIMSGFLKFYRAGLIDVLPKVIGVQSEHANPVYLYYQESDPALRRFEPVTVRPSVAQAAMIGNPVSMPRVIKLAREYDQAAGERKVFVMQVSEQAIMDWELVANRNGHIACTHGGESVAGMIEAKKQGIIDDTDVAVVDSTAHALKFSGFQEMYFERRFPDEFEISPDSELINAPVLVKSKDLSEYPAPGRPLTGDAMNRFVTHTARDIAGFLNIEKK